MAIMPLGESLTREAKTKDRKNEVPGGLVSELFQNKGKKLIAVEYRSGEHDSRLLRYKYETVAAAIVRYRRELNTPFPKKADKTLTVQP
jgi:hypothetical protein